MMGYDTMQFDKWIHKCYQMYQEQLTVSGQTIYYNSEFLPEITYFSMPQNDSDTT
jgi:hypothetical protein